MTATFWHVYAMSDDGSTFGFFTAKASEPKPSPSDFSCLATGDLGGILKSNDLRYAATFDHDPTMDEMRALL